jgi:hypothetical protein
MRIKMFDNFNTSHFQLGWNLIVSGKLGLYDLLVMGLDKFDLADFNAGIAAAAYKLTLPEHWLS